MRTTKLFKEYTLDAYKNMLFLLEEEHKEKRKIVILDYVRNTAQFKVGEIIKDHKEKIRIEKINAYIDKNKNPFPLYVGQRLGKGLKPKGEEGMIYGNSEITKIVDP